MESSKLINDLLDVLEREQPKIYTPNDKESKILIFISPELYDEVKRLEKSNFIEDGTYIYDVSYYKDSNQVIVNIGIMFDDDSWIKLDIDKTIEEKIKTYLK